MHLLKITNFDYGVMALFFATLLIVAYSFRRKNSTSSDFLLANDYNVSSGLRFIGLSGVGLAEFMLATSFGAYAGLVAIYLVVPVFFILAWIIDRVANKSSLIHIVQHAEKSSFSDKFSLICYILVMLISVGAAIAIIVSLFNSLLGWQFGNSTLSLMAIVLIGLLLGGVISVYYNQTIASLLCFILIALILFYASGNFGTFGFLKNLRQAALANQLPELNFINLSYSPSLIREIWLVIVACAVILIINPLRYLKYSRKIQFSNKIKISSRIIQLVLLLGMILIGVFALATPNKQATIINGQRIVTQQTRLADGSMGFVVKMVPTGESSSQMGIIPQQMTDDNQVGSVDSSHGVNDYISSGISLISLTLPAAFISLCLIIGLFFKSASEGVSFMGVLLIRGIFAPYYNKSGDDLENLWAARVFILAFVAVAIAVGLVLYKFYDLYFILSLLLVFAFPMVLNFCGLSKLWLVDAITYIGLIALILLIKITSVPSLLQLIPFNSLSDFVSMATVSSLAFYVFSWIIFTILGKKVS